MPDLRPYTGRWVALVAGRVAGSGRTPAEARQMANRNRPKERPQIGLVSPEAGDTLVTELPLADLMATLRPLLARRRPPVYLVGGAVRDALLGRASHDLDFAVESDAVGLARSVADALEGDFYLLDAERGTARVILESAVLDFACFRGEELLADLRDRDFSINAMALPAASSDVEALIDPLGGQNDLAAGLIRATGPAAIHQDPIRGLRAVRQAAELNLRITPETLGLIHAAADELPAVSMERVRDEFCRLLVAPHPAGSVRLLDELGLLPHILPELSRTKGVAQSPPHTTDVFEHTLLVVEQLEALLAPLTSPPAGEAAPSTPSPLGGTAPSTPPPSGGAGGGEHALAPYASHLAEHLARPTAGGRNGRMLLFLGALLHDVGKPDSRSVDEDGRIRFFGHERVGAEMAHRRARKLALSTNEVRQTATMVRHHMRPAWLSRTGPTLSRRSIYRFYRDTGKTGLDVCLLCLADKLGKGAPPDTEEWEQHIQTVAVLLDHYINHYKETVSPPPLLGGRELMTALHIRPGPEIGRLLRLIEEAQAAGDVSTLAGALTLAREAHKSLNRSIIE